METEPETNAYVPPVVDESRDLNLGAIDIVMSILTLPLLFWFMMYAVSGAEQMVATREARLKVYGVLLLLEAAIAAAIVAFFVLR